MPPVLSELMLEFAAAIAPGSAVELAAGAAAVARDEALLRALAERSGSETMLRLWVNHPCLVTTRRLAANRCFTEARARSEAAGWPVYVRSSGGSTVVQRPGILNVSLLCRTVERLPSIEKYYAPLTELLLGAFHALGVEATVGKREGSYCDGAFNILAGDRKIAGTSCRVIKSNGALAHLTHAVVWVEGDVAEDIAAVTNFETALGLNPHYQLDDHTTLQASLPVGIEREVCG